MLLYLMCLLDLIVVSSMLTLGNMLSSTTGSTSAKHVLKFVGLPKLVLECLGTDYIAVSYGDLM